MKRLNQIQHDFTRFFLEYDGNKVLIENIGNWEEINKEFLRSKQYKGFDVNITDKIEFKGETATILKQLLIEKPFDYDIEIIKEDRNLRTDTWEEVYRGRLDFSDASFDDNTFECNVNSELIRRRFVSRWRTELNIFNKRDLSGNEINDYNVKLIPIRMGARSVFSVNEHSIGTEYRAEFTNGQYANVLLTHVETPDSFPLKQSKEVRRETINPTTMQTGYSQDVNVDNFFFVKKSNTSEFYMDISADVELNGFTDCSFSLILGVFKPIYNFDAGEEHLDFQLKDEIEIFNTNNTVINRVTLEKHIDLSSVNLNEYNNCFSLYLKYDKNISSPREPNVYLIDLEVKINGVLNGVNTQSKVFTPFSYFQKHIKLMGGGTLISDYLKNCRFHLSKGFMFRNLRDKDGNIPPSSITFQKLFNSFNAVERIGLEVRGGNVRIEKLDYFFKDEIVCELGKNVYDIKFEFERDYAYSELNLGYQVSNFTKEEALNEFNVRSVWTTPISTFRNRFNAVSDIQASSFTIEKLRRVQYRKQVERTHKRRGDTTMFFIDLKDNENQVRDWEDDFDNQPPQEKQFSTAFNFRLSPLNILRRNAKWFNCAFFNNRNANFVFSSSDGNTNIKSKPIGEDYIGGENEDYPINETDIQKFVPIKATFKVVEDKNIRRIISDRGLTNNKIYGLFTFKHRGKKYLGYLTSYNYTTKEVKLILKNIE